VDRDRLDEIVEHLWHTPGGWAELAAEDIKDLWEGLQCMKMERNQAYTERNRLVSFLAKCFPSGVKKTDIPGWNEQWHNCVFIDTPQGQMSWHFHDSDAHLFAGLPAYEGEWDGHTTGEKYDRLEKLESPFAELEYENKILNEDWNEARRLYERYKSSFEESMQSRLVIEEAWNKDQAKIRELTAECQEWNDELEATVKERCAATEVRLATALELLTSLIPIECSMQKGWFERRKIFLESMGYTLQGHKSPKAEPFPDVCPECLCYRGSGNTNSLCSLASNYNKPLADKLSRK
jgi:hypothetical protein